MESKSIFRKEAIEYQNKRQFGDVNIVPNISRSLFTYFLVLFAIIVFSAIAFRNHTSRYSIEGVLLPSSEMQDGHSGDLWEVRLCAPLYLFDRLFEGQKVNLHFLNFSFRKYGTFRGNIKHIVPDGTTTCPNENSQVVSSLKDSFIVLVGFDQDESFLKNRGIEVVAGLRVKTEIVVRRKKIFKMILEQLDRDFLL